MMSKTVFVGQLKEKSLCGRKQIKQVISFNLKLTKGIQTNKKQNESAKCLERNIAAKNKSFLKVLFMRCLSENRQTNCRATFL